MKNIDHVQSTAEGWLPETAAEREAIHEQLDRLLANPLFKHSRRYPNLLRYVVEHTLQGLTTPLKERTLGVEVFGRKPDYDTNIDPVVRTTAGEIRRRIAQYYHEPGHEHEIRIGLPVGAYVAEFGLPPAVAPAPVPWSRRKVVALPVLAILAIVCAGLIWTAAGNASTSLLDQFWKPVLDSPNSILLCVGQPRLFSRVAGTPALPAEADVSVEDHHLFGSQNVALSDVLTLTRVAGLLQSKGKAFHIRGQAATLSDLRDGPVVLVGAFNNEWTLRLTADWRFVFQKDPNRPGISKIIDRHDPAHREWTIDCSIPQAKLASDYAIVARVMDPTLEKMIVVAAGIEKFGTIAAGEFLTNPGQLNAVLKQAPSNWSHKNFEAVIETKVINGNSGPPRLVATQFW